MHLNNKQLAALLDRWENNELDEYADIATLIGIEFDENTEWGQLTVLELKLLINLALKQLDAAQDLVGALPRHGPRGPRQPLRAKHGGAAAAQGAR